MSRSSDLPRHPQRHRQKRPRPLALAVPSSEESFQTNILSENAYEWDLPSFLESTFWRTPRPLPAMATMASLANTKGGEASKSNSMSSPSFGISPLVQSCIRALQHNGTIHENQTRPSSVAAVHEDGFGSTIRGTSIATKKGSGNGNEKGPTNGTTNNDAIDDPKNSTLVKGQHKRYQQLLEADQQSGSTASSWTDMKRKEYKRLRRCVIDEQQLYGQALSQFIQTHQERFLLGFIPTRTNDLNATATNKNASPATKNGAANAFAWIRAKYYVAQYHNQWIAGRTVTLNTGADSNCKKDRDDEDDEDESSTPFLPVPIYKKSAMQFGTCCQSLSLKRVSREAIAAQVVASKRAKENSRRNRRTGTAAAAAAAAPTTTTRDTSHPLLTLDSLSSEILHTRAVRSTTTTTRRRTTPLRKEHPTGMNWNDICDNKNVPMLLSPPKQPDNTIDLGSSSAATVTLLRNDQVALRLAATHNVSIVTTIETMQTLLQLPGDETTGWTIPVLCTSSSNNTESFSSQQNAAASTAPTTRHTTVTTGNRKRGQSTKKKTPLVVLDVPVPQPLTPRDCLAFGFEEALYQAMEAVTSSSSSSDSYLPTTLHTHDNDNDHKEDSNATDRSPDPGEYISAKHDAEYVYTLLTLPARSTALQHHHGPCKIIVRSMNRLLLVVGDKTEEPTPTPVRLYAQLEYFPERGWEDFTSHQKSMWILDKVLQPSCTVMVARISPQTARVLRWEEMSVAHALAGDGVGAIASDSIKKNVDPMWHFQAMVELVHGMDALEYGQQLLCLPERRTISSSSTLTSSSVSCSVSVHKAVADNGNKDKENDGHHIDTDTNTSVSLLSSASPTTRTSPIIDMEKELQDADAVFTGSQFLQRCFRQWKWEAPRIPFTFPIKGDL